MNILIMVALAFILDLLLGDPHSWPHPVKIIGRLIAWLTKKFNRSSYSARKKKWLGALTWLITVGGSGLVTYIVMRLVAVNYYLYMVIGTYISYTCISARQLAIEAEKIMKSLQQNNLKKARHQVDMIVGRDTDKLSAEEVTKATIETVAENTSDGVIAPLLFLVVGGPVLGIMYKAINTLDSMIGYRNERYKAFGEVSAKIDDIANYLPARITWLLLIISSWLLHDDTREAIAVGERDCEKHLSPNSAFSEAVVAGALHLQLGGPHYYFGELVKKPYIGNDHFVIAANWHLKRTITMLYLSSFLGLISFELIRFLIIWE
ncbi:cobalamin biosynthesis protein CobD [Limosilactobacillus reuteri]|uniref:adenosylcobinamide-phosphate synthase CbiB n=1 Tax=Limosilactobacillus reuteri TaxID=1598 RepID=UPI000C1B77AD|nr:adenosylcobinamide-phosphate synthase CbiB [Limosilactobacillus reuteri]PIN30310.1 cobalamin biosynthesis protein CobD [Limosilactobacillus reuteri]PUH34414.1 cobalamin biosynthesis protein CobD [Limosilactobacillus reuteri]PUH34470.1 cobalamin biosynthesis protein CobD [Limosilactobacillus reuteri]WLC95656.1 adenosylcobinamide-phosphate synthase CbiB [Limosilactobacillus reuteri]WRH77802.1 adenosylcobinamide-phosphate synthase CbiB [Limosilactobacillus reuteri]